MLMNINLSIQNAGNIKTFELSEYRRGKDFSREKLTSLNLTPNKLIKL